MKMWVIAFGLTQAVVFGVLAVSVMRLRESKVSLVDNKRNAEICKQLAAEIRGLRQLESVAEENNSTAQLENSAVLAIASKCRINETQIRSIQRIPPESISGTEYIQQGISVMMTNVSLFQVNKFAIEAEHASGNPKTTLISLNEASRRSDSNVTAGRIPHPELWNAQVILTQLVYDATSHSKPPARSP
ncbi:hypothetical protein U8335_13615 [Roseiconus lacunae]|uniref:hypothetical protein n=1 Tax=Roseiconus lacunae TaxID=2605694 RepID=UPI0030936AAC|nr:hypothetical protein U8335_13615 [Stieleria sp. HD01]